VFVVLRRVPQALEISLTRIFQRVAYVIGVYINMKFVINVTVSVFMNNVIDAGIAKYVLDIFGGIANLVSVAPRIDFCQQYAFAANPREMVDQGQRVQTSDMFTVTNTGDKSQTVPLAV
jgi:hypothetical protein